MTQRLWATLNLACQDASFGALHSQIRHIIIEILTVNQNSAEQTDTHHTKKQSNNLLVLISPSGGQATPKLWALLNVAHQDTSVGTLQSQIRHTVMEILTVEQNIAKWATFNIDNHLRTQQITFTNSFLFIICCLVRRWRWINF
jgi:hypothetical protein